MASVFDWIAFSCISGQETNEWFGVHGEEDQRAHQGEGDRGPVPFSDPVPQQTCLRFQSSRDWREAGTPAQEGREKHRPGLDLRWERFIENKKDTEAWIKLRIQQFDRKSRVVTWPCFCRFRNWGWTGVPDGIPGGSDQHLYLPEHQRWYHQTNHSDDHEVTATVPQTVISRLHAFCLKHCHVPPIIRCDPSLLTSFRGEMNSSTQRLLIDWLELLDPEMISTNPVVEQSLLFGCLESKVYLYVNTKVLLVIGKGYKRDRWTG